MDSEKRYLPTQAKLESLREEGIVPYEPFAMIWVLLIVLVLGAYGLGASPLDSWKNLLMSPDGIEGIGSVVKAFLVNMILLAISGGCIAFIFGLIQTRGWLSFQKLSPDVGALWDSSRIMPMTFFSRIIIGIMICAIALIVSALAFWRYGSTVFGLLNSDPKLFFAWLGAFLKSLLLSTGIISAAILLISLLIGRLLFMYRNRMTRAELEQEMREGS